MIDAFGQIDVLALVLAALLVVVVAVRRSARRACHCGALARHACVRCGHQRVSRYCAQCGWPTRGLPRSGSPNDGGQSAAAVAKAVAPASPETAWDARSPASRLRAGWCQGAVARDRRGSPVFPRESVAVSWSLPGAMAASLDSGTPEWTAYLRRIGQVLGAPGASLDLLAEWNDDPSRTQADVVAAAAAAEKVGC